MNMVCCWATRVYCSSDSNRLHPDCSVSCVWTPTRVRYSQTEECVHAEAIDPPSPPTKKPRNDPKGICELQMLFWTFPVRKRENSAYLSHPVLTSLNDSAILGERRVRLWISHFRSPHSYFLRNSRTPQGSVMTSVPLAAGHLVRSS